MSRGQSQPGNQSPRRVLERCRTRNSIEIIDVDKEKIDLVIVDAEETSHLGSRCSETTRRHSCPSGVISIDDEDESTDDSFRNVHSDAARKEFCPASSNSPMSEESKSDECPMTTRKKIPPFRSMQYMRKCREVGPSTNRFGLSESSESWSSESDSSEFDSSESISSDSDSSDCEIMEDSSGNIREQWERAALKKKMSDRVRFGSEDQASALGSSKNDAGLFSEEAIYHKIDIENCINKVCSNYFEEIPAETYPKYSSYEKENISFNIPADNGLHGSFWKKNADTTDSDRNDATNIGHNEPEHAAETCSHKTQSPYEAHSDNLRFGFRDPETVLCTSICDLNMQHDPEIKDDDVRDLDKDEQVPATTSGTTGLHGESSIWGKVGPCPGQSSPPNAQPSPDNTIQDKKKHCPGEPPLSMQPQCDYVASPETVGLQRKDKSSSDESSLCNYQYPGSSPLNVDCQTNLEEPPVCYTNGGSGATERRAASDTAPHNIPQVHSDLICERERHKESAEYRCAVEEEWAARQRQLQIQAEEVQKMKRKRKAESLRALNMAKRQKQRLEEIRESQKKDEETINLKEHLRAEVRKELEKIELRYRDMASLLRGLGIRVGGGPYPMPHEINNGPTKAKEPNKGVVIEKGRGTPLKNIPNVAHKLARKKPGDLKLLHQTLFGRKGKAVDFKNHILQFSGFAWHESDEKQRAKVKEELDKCVKDTLLDLCDLMDISVSKTNSRKDDLITKLLDFMAAPHATTDVLLAEMEQQSPKPRKRKMVARGSASKGTEDTSAKRSWKKRMKSEGTPSSEQRSAIDTDDEEDDDEHEDDSQHGVPDENEELERSESEKESESKEAGEKNEDEDKAESADEDSGKGKKGMKKSPKKQNFSKKEKVKMESSSTKTPPVTTAKSPTKTPSPTRSKPDGRNDVGEKVFVRRKKNVDPPKKKSTSKPDAKEKSGGKRGAGSKTKSEGAGHTNPSKEELRKAICETLKKVDFNAATFTDVLKQLAIRYKVDLTPRKAAIKLMIREELTKLAVEAEDNEDDEDEQDSEKEEHREPTCKKVEV